jgi:hypothetical protein
VTLSPYEQRLAEHAALIDDETHYATIEKQAEAYLNDTDDAILACRGQGHAWPKLRAPKAGRSRLLPKGIEAQRFTDGSWQITSTCPDCGMQRTLTTLPGGPIDHPAQYRYVQPEGYKAPKGSGITRRDCLDETWRRLREAMPAERGGTR